MKPLLVLFSGLFLCLGLLSQNMAWAVSPEEILEDPVLEARARVLSKEIRCVVCQNQSIDQSDAPLAVDLRRIVREQLVEGKTDQEIKNFMVARFGDFVLFSPPANGLFRFLWFLPFILFLALLLLFFLRMSSLKKRGE